MNVASRMESHGTPGSIQVCASSRALLVGRYLLSPPHALDVKGKGRLQAAYLLGRAA